MFSANPVCFLCIRGRICNLLVVTLIRNPVFHDNCKFASFSQLTFCFNGSAHHINIFLYDRHSQTCSCNLCGCCIAFPGKSLKQGWQEFFTHSDTCILTNKFNQCHITDTAHLSAVKYNLALVPVILNGIAQYIHKHTFYMYRASNQVPMFNLIIALNNFQLTFFRLFLDHINNVIKQLF